MKNWENILFAPNQLIREALLKLDATGTQMILVVDENRKLLGTLSDGDLRRGLLKGLALADTVDKCMFRFPRTVFSHDGRDLILATMRRLKLHQVPIVDRDFQVVGMEVLDDYLLPMARENWVVLMAGGLGTRLGELTKSTPKPMLHVGDKPLLETILRNFVNQGFQNFFLSVNYLSEVIEAHFGDGERFGANIRYLKESKRMGTAGALTLLPEIPTEPMIVANGDLLANIDYLDMLEVHVDSGVIGTMGVSEYEYQIPYGVVCEENGIIQRIDEKPVHKSLISAGVYVLSPPALGYMPKDVFFDMPNLFEALITNQFKTATYKVHGYWLDIGQIPDLRKANADITTAFD
jgi:dTDP-glucose pyrophosphorylase